MHFTEIETLIPLMAAQIGIALVLRKRLGKRLRGIWVAAYWLGFCVLAVFASMGILFSVYRHLAPFFRPVRTAALLWMFPALPALLLYLVYARAKKNLSRQPMSARRRQVLRTAGMVAVAAPFCVEAWGVFITRTNFRVQEIELPITGLHPDLAGLRILQISDVHLSPYLSEREFARAIDASNELRPQVAVMTGDLISSWGDPIDACLRQLSRIKADAPLLGCMGNHEIYADAERYTEVQSARLGMTFLRQKQRSLKFGNGVLNIAGIDYRPFALRGGYLRGAGKLLVPGAANILLSHNPDVFTEAPRQGWQAMLAGHTHGGQVTVEILKQEVNVARLVTRYVSGLYQEQGASCYVTRGIGTIGIPVRMGATPEITLLRLKRA